MTLKCMGIKGVHVCLLTEPSLQCDPVLLVCRRLNLRVSEEFIKNELRHFLPAPVNAPTNISDNHTMTLQTHEFSCISKFFVTFAKCGLKSAFSPLIKSLTLDGQYCFYFQIWPCLYFGVFVLVSAVQLLSHLHLCVLIQEILELHFLFLIMSILCCSIQQITPIHTNSHDGVKFDSILKVN